MTLEAELAELITDLGTDWKNLWAKLGAGTLDTSSQNFRGAINELKAAIESVSATVPDASTTVKGVQENATNLEAAALVSEQLSITPSNLAYLRGLAGGLAGLDGGGKVPSAQLPSFVDDVIEGANLAAFPVTGEAGKIYTALDTGKTYRWGGSAYAEISASPGSTDAVTEGATNLYYTQSRADARADARITALVGDTNTDLAALYVAAKA